MEGKQNSTPNSEDPVEEITVEGDQPLASEKTEASSDAGLIESKPATSNEAAPPAGSKQKEGKKHKFWPPTKKQLLITGGVIVVLLLLITLIQPVRNVVAGLFFKTSLTVEAYDEFQDEESGSKQRLQLAGLEIKVDGKTMATNATSPVKLTKVKPGTRTVTITKINYKTFSAKAKANLRFGAQTNSVSYKLDATGRPVKVSVVNHITGEAIETAELKSGTSNAKTDQKGQAVIVLPVGSQTKYEVIITKDGYNESKQELTVPTRPTNKATELQLTPSGKIYFLSKQSGKVDVVKTNLDGSERTVVLAGTGKEDHTTASLIATTDWRYLAFHTRRSDNKYQLLMIDTKTDSNTVIDEGDAIFRLVGWSGKQLVYQTDTNTLQQYQAGKYKIKTYNADSKSLKTVYQSQASGSSNFSYTGEYPGEVKLVSGRIIYDISPSQAGNASPPGQGTIRSANADGSNGKTLYTYETTKGYLSLVYTSATEAYYSFTEYNSTTVIYYEVESNGNFKQGQKPDNTEQFTYFISPDNSQTLWAEEQDGKQTVFIGDTNGKNPKELYRLSELKPFGWYTKDYALYSKNNSELYIAPLKEKAEPKKVSDYHRPSQVDFVGYGGGYGGAY